MLNIKTAVAALALLAVLPSVADAVAYVKDGYNDAAGQLTVPTTGYDSYVINNCVLGALVIAGIPAGVPVSITATTIQGAHVNGIFIATLTDSAVTISDSDIDVGYVGVYFMLTTRSPVDFAGTPWKARSTAPGIGEHTREVLADLGRSDAEIEALLATGAATEGGSD